MSDFDDDLLALAEGRDLGKKSKTSKPKRKRSPKPESVNPRLAASFHRLTC